MEGRFDKSNNKLLCEIKDLLGRLLNKPEIESLTPIPLCVDGNLTGYIAFSRDEETNEILEFYFDTSLNSINTKPIGEACVAKPDIEYKYFEKERCIDENGNQQKVTEVLCLKYEDGVLVDTETYWIVDGLKVDINPGVFDCEEIQTFLADSIDFCIDE